jgi:hypothetical protein
MFRKSFAKRSHHIKVTTFPRFSTKKQKKKEKTTKRCEAEEGSNFCEI